MPASAIPGRVAGRDPRARRARAPEEAEIAVSTEIPDWNAVELARAIAGRTVSCTEVMQAFLARIDSVNPIVNAIVSLRSADALLAEARARDDDLAAGRRHGPLHGMPQAIKDLAPCAGLPTTLGSPLFAGSIAQADNIMVERMRAAGAIFVGKTNVPEFGLGSQTYNPVFGRTLNAYDQTKTSGGSSGGAGVALALGMLPVADGSDHAGSLRNPAAYNNVFGLRPTAGRVPGGTDEVFLPSLTVAGPMARTVPDLALLLSVQAGYDARVPSSTLEDPAIFASSLDGGIGGWRIGWLGDLGGEIPFEPGILDLCEAGLRVMERLGAVVEPARPDFPLETMFQEWIKLRAWGFASTRGALYADPATRDQLKPEARWEVERGLALSAADIDRASRARTGWYESLRRLFETYDVLVLPGAQAFPFPVATHWPTTIDGRTMDTYHRWMQVMIPFTMGNLPAISVPAGFGPTGLPMGLQIAGPSHAELKVLRIAKAYDDATGWVRRARPPLLSGLGPAATS